MKRVLLQLGLLAFFLPTQAQNLVKNGGFESYKTAPIDEGHFDVDSWYNPNPKGGRWPASTPAHLHSSGSGSGNWKNEHFGVSKPYKGNGMVLLVDYNPNKDNFREYAYTELTAPLVVGKKYRLSMYLSKGESDFYGIYTASGFGAYVGVKKPVQEDAEVLDDYRPNYQFLPVYDKPGWSQVVLEFEAREPAKYLMLGNFHNDERQKRATFTTKGKYDNFSILFIDEVVLEPSDGSPIASAEDPERTSPMDLLGPRTTPTTKPTPEVASSGDNLLVDGGFERYDKLPSADGEFLATYWKSANKTYDNWPNATPDYIHANGTGNGGATGYKGHTYYGEAKPVDGKAMIVLNGYNGNKADFREYAVTQPTGGIKKGHKYRFEIYASLGEGDYYGCMRSNGWGVMVSESWPSQSSAEIVSPSKKQIAYFTRDEFGSKGWEKYTIEFTAEMDGQYLTLGNYITDGKQKRSSFTSSCRYAPQSMVFFDKASLVDISTTPAIKPSLSYDCKETNIVDPGEIYSTYSYGGTDRATLKAQGFSEAQIDHIVTMSHERSWPTKMVELDSRLDNPSVIKKYNVCQIATLDNKVVLWVRKSKNGSMPSGFAPTEDFYILLGKSGIGTPAPEVVPTPDPIPEPEGDGLSAMTRKEAPKTFMGRDIVESGEIKLAKDEIVLEIWDNLIVDGDTISLQFNGEWLLEYHMVSKTVVKIPIKIDPTKNNLLVLHAHNLGSMPPNTAEVAYTDAAGKRQVLTIKSDFTTSGAIRFVPPGR